MEEKYSAADARADVEAYEQNMTDIEKSIELMAKSGYSELVFDKPDATDRHEIMRYFTELGYKVELDDKDLNYVKISW